MENKSGRVSKETSGKKISSASDDSLNDFRTPPSTRNSKLSDNRNIGCEGDDFIAREIINESFDNKPDENQPGPSNSKKSTKRTVSPSDNSLADFKSPKLDSKPSVKILDMPKPKPKKVKRKTKKDSNQMSIESSFFKPATSFACPLCLKTFTNSVTQLSHSKTCASKNNVSTRKLLEAHALQERQGEERRALGLPAQPFAQPRRKPTFKRSDLRGEDPDVQLALALSESLKEAQDIEELDTAIALAGDEVPINSSNRRSTLQSFGFLTNKPAVEVTERPKKKKLISQTVLQTRTEATRQRLLAEKIAEVIVDNANSTCLPVNVEDELGPIKLTSKLLKEIHEPGNRLWNSAAARERGEFYYVKELAKFIAPINSEKDTLDLSDRDKVSGPLNQESKPVNNSIIVESNDEDLKVKKEDKSLEEMKKALESSEKALERSQSILEAAERSLESDCSLKFSKSWSEGSFPDIALSQQASLDKIEMKEKSNNISLVSKAAKTPEEKKNIQETPKRFRKSIVESSLAQSWRKMLNSSQCSDVLVRCSNDKFIYAHSVVLWTRCELLYKDLISKDDLENFGASSQLRYQLNWTEIDFNTALVFLEFIYCGFIENLSTEVDKLTSFGEKYNYELIQYLKNCKNFSFKNSNPINVKINNTNVTMSPDIFDGMDSITCDNSIKVEEKTVNLIINEKIVDIIVSSEENSVSNEVFDKESDSKNEEIITDDKNLKTILRRSSTCPDSLRDIEKMKTPRSFSEDLNDSLKKTRSELSVFIEKIQKRNARDILEDSDDDSFLPEINKINKFKKHDESLSDRYKNVEIDSGNINLRRGSRFWATKKSIEKPQPVEVKKSGLSLFEDDIRQKVASEPDKFKGLGNIESDCQLTDEKDLSNLTQSIDVDDPDVSMYTKYKLSHKDNSIAYYRDLIKDSKGIQDKEESYSETIPDNDEDLTGLRKSHLNFSKEEQLDDLEDDLVIELDEKNVEQSILSQKSQLDIEFEDEDFEDDDFNIDKIIEESFNPQEPVDATDDKVIDVESDFNDSFVDYQVNFDEYNVNSFGNLSQDVINTSQQSSKQKSRRISTTNQLYLQELSRYNLYKSTEANIDEESVLDLTLSDEEKEEKKEKEEKSYKRQRSVEDLSAVESADDLVSPLKKKKAQCLRASAKTL